MMAVALVVARKELMEHLRDGRSLCATLLYTLMGPGVIALVAFARGGPGAHGPIAPQLAVMASVFTLVAAFTGGMSVAMDTVAGERERRSLLPLLSNAVPPVQIVLGKWIAASAFAVAGAVICLAAFVVLLKFDPVAWLLCLPPLIALALFAAAGQVLLSATCRSVKEAHTYLSMLIFFAMGVGMWFAFQPSLAAGFWEWLPVGGHQRLLQLAFSGNTGVLIESLVLTALTLAAAILALVRTGQLFRQDAIVFGH